MGESGSYNVTQIDSDTSLILKEIAFYLLSWSTLNTFFYTAIPVKTINTSSPASQGKNICL